MPSKLPSAISATAGVHVLCHVLRWVTLVKQISSAWERVETGESALVMLVGLAGSLQLCRVCCSLVIWVVFPLFHVLEGEGN